MNVSSPTDDYLLDEDLETIVEDGPEGGDTPTREHADIGAIAELRARFANGEEAIALYQLPDRIVVGRGSACDWQLKDNSLSRRHTVLHWNGTRLEVEDLGSANGTYVNGSPIKGRTPIARGGSFALGNVTITFGDPQSAGPDADLDPDHQPTAYVQLPDNPSRRSASPGAILPTPPIIAPIPAPARAPTRPPVIAPVPAPPGAAPFIRPTPSARQARQGTAKVFRPAFNLASPGDLTATWDPTAATAKAREQFLGGGWQAIVAKWHANRRPFVLVGAALWVVVLLAVVLIHESMVNTVDESYEPADSQATTKPKPVVVKLPTVTSLNTDPLAVPPEAQPPENQAPFDAETTLAEAIAAYDQGKMEQALAGFKRLVASRPRDPAPRYMVELIESRRGAP